ncbi:NAD(P)-binding protein [Ascodesmis nigricans]|uniref:NAD(P)-binding protein n=1 Tax=Ascodesmis nigricans TaxID=341454 RepID=A0A4V3SJ57_9PEZI|nr:NAD(P)-binding protein [Ascodesmis nigricans]
MTRVLLTGASGFIAAHILDLLLAHNHSVRITVRSQQKADALISAHPDKAHLIDVAIVPDINAPGAFDAALQSHPPFEAVLHTASPFHFNITRSIDEDLLNPAINGTRNVLAAVKQYAPSVKTVVITSSFASIVDAGLGLAPGKVYTEKDWNPITLEQARENASLGYRGSKTWAEKTAWEFLEKEKPNFNIVTVNPPLVLGPVKPYLAKLETINTSNERIRDILTPKAAETIKNTGTYLWVDVREVAAAHVLAFEKPEAAGNRFFVVAGRFSNQLIADIVKKDFPEYAVNIPEERLPLDGYPAESDAFYNGDNTKSREVLGLHYRSLEESIVDTVKSLKEIGA